MTLSFKVLRKYLPGGFAGYDKDGCPIWLELYGYMDPKGLLSSAKKSDIEKTKLLVGEQIMQKLDEQSKKVSTHLYKTIWWYFAWRVPVSFDKW